MAVEIFNPDYEVLLGNIIQEELELENSQVLVINQNFTFPKFDYLFVVVGFESFRATSNNNYHIDDPNGSGILEVQEIAGVSTYHIDVMSQNDEAKSRKEEVLAALQSIYSEQTQEENRFEIFRIPSEFLNTSVSEGSSMYFKYSINIALTTSFRKVKSPPAAPKDYYDEFESRVDDNVSIVTGEPICYLTSDDSIKPKKYEEIYNIGEKSSEYLIDMVLTGNNETYNTSEIGFIYNMTTNSEKVFYDIYTLEDKDSSTSINMAFAMSDDTYSAGDIVESYTKTEVDWNCLYDAGLGSLPNAASPVWVRHYTTGYDIVSMVNGQLVFNDPSSTKQVHYTRSETGLTSEKDFEYKIKMIFDAIDVGNRQCIGQIENGQKLIGLKINGTTNTLGFVESPFTYGGDFIAGCSVSFSDWNTLHKYSIKREGSLVKALVDGVEVLSVPYASMGSSSNKMVTFGDPTGTLHYFTHIDYVKYRF